MSDQPLLPGPAGGLRLVRRRVCALQLAAPQARRLDRRADRAGL